MDPVTAITIASAASSAVGSIQQGNAASGAASYNSKVAAQNADIAMQNSYLVGAQGDADVGIQGAKNKAQVGATIANQGASGVDVNSGSAVAVRQSEAKIGMLNELNIRSQAAQKAYGFQTQAASDTAQSQLDASQAKSAKTAGYIGAATSVLGGIAQASMYSKLLADTSPVGNLTGVGVATTVPNNTGGFAPGFMLG